MLRVREDEPGAFEELVERFQQRLVSVMTHLVGRGHEAEDLSQDVFLRVYQARKRYHPQSRFSTWLFTIANNLALNHLRSRQRKSAVPIQSTSESGSHMELFSNKALHDPGTGPMQKIQKNELAERIQSALSSLGEKQRMAVILNKFEDMSYAEIAEVMGMTVKAVKSLLSRARVNLRTALSEYIFMDGDSAPASSPGEED
ncbi:MAG: RNA polymerase sigma factor [Gemmataceae bacterium]